MGLETATFISGLTPSWPTSSELKSQGDDHLRLIKQTLQNTFPAAAKPFYFPKVTASTATVNLVAADQNTVVSLDTTGGNVTVNLPSTLGAIDNGWSCEILKSSFDANAAIVNPASGTIRSKSGDTATIRVGIVCEPARFIWNGTSWYCVKTGPMIGSTESYDGTNLPPGYLTTDGSAFSNTAFAELFANLGSSVLFDKRGRVEAGIDAGHARLSVTFWGAPTLGSAAGSDSNTQTTSQMPAHFHTADIFDPTHDHQIASAYGQSSSGFSNGIISAGAGAGFSSGRTQSSSTGVRVTSATNGLGTTYSNGGGQAMNNIQPTIIVRKMTRAC
jgi:microcystin-dependent protein